ncbi:penicillin-binding protein 2 [Sphaerotilus mobilis]|uniref:Peptidoglycan D,D-transpeptidase MrdA n=1 Tax=Sphaerotilus mobilis TaxID=47994 RepID=A0A4Q7M6K9_9BURK|nr:penicillin-binding protein 2 [Sphaerotilus mobilis]RZS63324.1 peptidoglycan glycosyltransferase /cell elongation-specific peptidoglycan D,D-transpeptidase [Sphaerotilus mobilis]
MIELRNVEQELEGFRTRLIVAALVVLGCFGLLVIRLVHLQIFTHEELATQAENNRIAVVPIVPNRGLIVDRNGVVLADNYSAYTLEINRSQLGEPLEVVIDQLAEVVEIQPRDRRRFRRLMEDSKSFESLPIRTKLSDAEVARFTAQRYRFPGVEIKARLFRNYPYGELASHVLGYIGRINQAEKAAMDEWSEEDYANYRGTEVIGKLGIEQRYERELHGITGVEEVETSAGGRPVRRLRSEPSSPGNTVRLSLDIKLQALVERLYGDRRGALVAIDPRNGEVLAFVSKPTFDPNLFVDGIDQDSWKELNESIDKPLLNRALKGTYPPGSTFKPFMAIAALNSGKRSATQVINDSGSFMFGNHRFRSHGDSGLGPVDMVKSIVLSSNVYYYSLANEMGVDLMHQQLAPFSFGRRTGIDLDGEATGDLPSTEWKRRKYKRPDQQRWYAGETISLGIGQGYNNFTMLQMAHAMATLVSGGQRHEPRLVSDIENVVSHERRPPPREPLEALALKPEHVEVIRRALHGVTVEGTSTRVFAGAPYASGGKTGTAQAKSVGQNEKYNAARMDEYVRDHSLYTAFAPLDQPTVALAVIVENAGFGAEAAAPIARRVLDYLLTGQYPSEEDIELTRIGKAGAPLGRARLASEVPLPTLMNAGIATPVAASDAASGAAPASAASATPRPR